MACLSLNRYIIRLVHPVFIFFTLSPGFLDEGYAPLVLVLLLLLHHRPLLGRKCGVGLVGLRLREATQQRIVEQLAGVDLGTAQFLRLGAVGAVVRHHEVRPGAVGVLVLLHLHALWGFYELAGADCRQVNSHHGRAAFVHVDGLDGARLVVLGDLASQGLWRLVRA